MKAWSRKSRAKSAAKTSEQARQALWEHEATAVFAYLDEMRKLDPADPLPAALAALIGAAGPRQVLVAVRDEPQLLGERGRAGMQLLESFAEMLGAGPMRRVVQERAAWLEVLREAGADPGRMRLPGD
ncbi:hypothetical protein [Streptomyces sp. NPDC054863]